MTPDQKQRALARIEKARRIQAADPQNALAIYLGELLEGMIFDVEDYLKNPSLSNDRLRFETGRLAACRGIIDDCRKMQIMNIDSELAKIEQGGSDE